VTDLATFNRRRNARDAQAGYSLLEMLIAVAVLMIVSAGIFTGVQDLTRVSDTVNNRSEMHAGVRNATELMQQEVGQAGKISLPAPVWLTTPVVIPSDTVPQTMTVNSAAGMFAVQTLTIDVGANQESVQLTAVNTAANSITGIFRNVHAVNAPVRVEGAFFAGVVPTNYLNGSTPTTLKMFGDINSDGNMVYVEYSCVIPPPPATGVLYRNSMPITAGVKAAPDVTQVLLNNLLDNPGGTPCFTYQQQTVSGLTFVTDVAITLTVQTERRDPLTGLFQTETKALLNVSPRNVFNVWQLATLNMTSRVQSVPASVTALLP
jgi:prepilin-type N-terminal cleavage/methylation domain-containing protein